jgi:hypothetical protein
LHRSVLDVDQRTEDIFASNVPEELCARRSDGINLKTGFLLGFWRKFSSDVLGWLEILNGVVRLCCAIERHRCDLKGWIA